MSKMSSVRVSDVPLLLTPDEYKETLANNLLQLKHSYEQYVRNMLWLPLVIHLIKERHELSNLSKRQLDNVADSIKSEAKKTSRGVLHLYLKRLTLDELDLPMSLEGYKKELLMGLTYLIGNCPQLEEKLPYELRNTASSKARKDINIYLMSCTNKEHKASRF
jgi:hypothetical protein